MKRLEEKVTDVEDKEHPTCTYWASLKKIEQKKGIQ